MHTASILGSTSAPIWIPLQVMWSRLILRLTASPAHNAARLARASSGTTRAPNVASDPIRLACPAQKVASPTPQRAHRPLRVVRVLEANQVATSAGRMVLSGRIADVCAELERLAACETTRP